MNKDWCSEVPGGIRMIVQVVPNAKKNEAVCLLDDAIKIRLHAQPIEGKANEALVRYVADMLGVPKSAVNITHGHTSKRKILEIHDRQLSADMVRKAFMT